MKISEIEALLKAASIEEIPNKLQAFQLDERSGVKKIVEKYTHKYAHYEEEKTLWEMKTAFDEVFHEKEKVLVGIDEVGRGPLAGPVVAAAVILPYDVTIIGLKDSKKLSELKREALYDEIINKAIAIGIGQVDAPEIDEINILQATFKAMRQAIAGLNKDYDLILVDGDKTIPKVAAVQHAVIGGDNKSASIAAASVIAKVTRDRLMRELAEKYPGYDWESNKGYGSSAHYKALHEMGLTPLHRKTFLKNEGIL